jgi:hypothetical protein
MTMQNARIHLMQTMHLRYAYMHTYTHPHSYVCKLRAPITLHNGVYVFVCVNVYIFEEVVVTGFRHSDGTIN